MTWLRSISFLSVVRGHAAEEAVDLGQPLELFGL
jgi:hypothetical protein